MPGTAHARLKQCYELILELMKRWREQDGYTLEMEIRAARRSRGKKALLNRSLNSSTRSSNRSRGNLSMDEDDEDNEDEDEEVEYVIMPASEIQRRVRQTLSVLQCVSRLSSTITHAATSNATTSNATTTTTAAAVDLLDVHQLVDTKNGWIAKVLHREGSKRSRKKEKIDPTSTDGSFWCEIRRHVCVAPGMYSVSRSAAVVKSEDLRYQRKKRKRTREGRSGHRHSSGGGGQHSSVRGVMSIEDTRNIILLRRLCNHMDMNTDYLRVEFVRSMLSTERKMGAAFGIFFCFL